MKRGNHFLFDQEDDYSSLCTTSLTVLRHIASCLLALSSATCKEDSAELFNPCASGPSPWTLTSGGAAPVVAGGNEDKDGRRATGQGANLPLFLHPVRFAALASANWQSRLCHPRQRASASCGVPSATAGWILRERFINLDGHSRAE